MLSYAFHSEKSCMSSLKSCMSSFKPLIFCLSYAILDLNDDKHRLKIEFVKVQKHLIGVEKLA